uniref:Glycosyltransferases n=1 Tax=Glycine max TaxID=3847 RepID=A0A368UJE8_SOYBN
MASFRRTLSPAYPDRQYLNGSFSVSSPSHKLPSSNAKYSSPLPELVAAFLRLAGGVFTRRHGRKGQWRRVVVRCVLCFFVGFLLGMFPFGHVSETVRSHEFSFEMKPPPLPRAANNAQQLLLEDRVLRNRYFELLNVKLSSSHIYQFSTCTAYNHDVFMFLECSRFGTWPVAMLAPSKNKAILEGPVCNASQVIGWHTNEKSKRLRRFHVDMSGFAFNSTILWDPKRWRRPSSNPVRQLDTVKEGFQETTFIEQLVEDESQMEGSPPGCSKILNWHLHLAANNIVYPKGWVLQKNLDAVIPVK